MPSPDHRLAMRYELFAVACDVDRHGMPFQFPMCGAPDPDELGISINLIEILDPCAVEYVLFELGHTSPPFPEGLARRPSGDATL